MLGFIWLWRFVGRFTKDRLDHLANRFSSFSPPAVAIRFSARPGYSLLRIVSDGDDLMVAALHSYLPLRSLNRLSCASMFRSNSLYLRSSLIHSAVRRPCLSAFCDVLYLPGMVRGPVDFSHGFHCLIFSACTAFCSAVQRRGMLFLPIVG